MTGKKEMMKDEHMLTKEMGLQCGDQGKEGRKKNGSRKRLRIREM